MLNLDLNLSKVVGKYRVYAVYKWTDGKWKNSVSALAQITNLHFPPPPQFNCRTSCSNKSFLSPLRLCNV